jgi:hypothetical protein
MNKLSFLLASMLLTVSCGSSPPANGKQACAPAGVARRCPDGLVCQSDDHCWLPGTGPNGGTGGVIGDDGGPGTGGGGGGGGGTGGLFDAAAGTGGSGSTYDAALPRDAPPFEATPSRPLPSGYRQVPGGRTAESETYRVVKTAPPPPGSSHMQSERYRLVGGLVGATQR